MRSSVAVLCQDAPSLQTLKATLEGLGIDQVTCRSQHEAMELVLGGSCSTLIVDFDLPGAGDVVKMAALLAAPQKPVVLAMTKRAWPGTGHAFQSGAGRILYKPLDRAQVKDAFETSHKLKGRDPRRKAPRCEMKALVYLEFETGTLPAVGVDLSEHGFGVQATQPISQRSNLAFHCALPGTSHTLRGRADVMWADGQGRAGMFFSRLAPSARKDLKQWLRKHSTHSKDAARALLPPADASLCTVAPK